MQTEEIAVPEWTLGDRLRKAREHAGLSQTELAAKTGISLTSVSRYETDRTTPARPVLLAWSLCTGIDLNWLVGAGSINTSFCTAPAPRTAWALAA